MSVIFDVEFEENVLSHCLRDTTYLQQASRILDNHHLSTKHHAWIWEQVRKHWYTYREPVTPKKMGAVLRTNFPKLEDRKPYIALAKKLYKRKVRAPRSDLEELELFVRKVQAQVSMEEAAKHLEKDDKESVDKVYEALGKLTQNNLRARNYTSVKWLEEFKERQADRKFHAEHPEAVKRVPCGWKRIDIAMEGGLAIGEFGAVMGTTGRGKSVTLAEFMFNGCARGFNGLYVALEMPARQIAQRLDARWLGVPYNKLKAYDWTSSELDMFKRRLKMAKHLKERVRIVSMPTRACNIDTLEGVLDDLYHESGFVPDVLYLDSCDHMVAKDRKRQESFRIEQAGVYWDVKDLLERRGYAGWTSMHAGRDWANKTATTEAASESYDKSRIVDVALSINKPKKRGRGTIELDDDDSEEAEKMVAKARSARGDLLEIHLAKHRDGLSGITFTVDADFARMHMSELLEDEE